MNDLKPQLVNLRLSKKIFNTINPPPPKDYWAPTKNTLQDFYKNYISPNMYLILFILLICLLLLYRYRTIHQERFEQVDKQQSSQTQHSTLRPQPIQSKDNQKNEDNLTADDYAKIIMLNYEREKQLNHEPKIQYKKSPNTEFVQIPENKFKKFQQKPQFAYPLYPYAGGGKLMPSQKT